MLQEQRALGRYLGSACYVSLVFVWMVSFLVPESAFKASSSSHPQRRFHSYCFS